MTQTRPRAFKTMTFNRTQVKVKPFLVEWMVSGGSLESLEAPQAVRETVPMRGDIQRPLRDGGMDRDQVLL